MFPERLPAEQHGYWLKLHAEIPAARADGGGVDVFQQNNRARRHGGEQIADAFVGDVGRGEAEGANVELKLRGQRRDQRRFARARRTIKQITAPPGIAELFLTLLGGKKLLQVRNDGFLLTLFQHHRRQLAVVAAPRAHPFVVISREK